MEFNKSIGIGIMQGRLSKKLGLPLQSFPEDTWEDEFIRAKKIGFNKLEWLIDKECNYKNPIFSEEGRNRINQLSNKYQIKIDTLCSHFIIYGGILNHSDNTENIKKYFLKTLEVAPLIGVKYLSIPLMDKMSLRNKVVRKEVENFLQEITSKTSIEILIESDLSNLDSLAFLNKLISKKIGILYDTGNSTKNNYSFIDNFHLISSKVKQIHIKDFSLKLNKSVRLGEGDTNLEEVFKTIKLYGWEGPIILETPISNNWEKEAFLNFWHIKKLINKYNF